MASLNYNSLTRARDVSQKKLVMAPMPQSADVPDEAHSPAAGIADARCGRYSSNVS
jgi:hypothetical protein